MPLWSLRNHASVRAFLVIAYVAVAQSLLLGWMISTQRDAAHIIEASGAQRMRIQRVAYLSLAVSNGHGGGGARVELDHTIRDILTTRAELVGYRDVLGHALSGTNRRPVHLLRYLDAARTLARDGSRRDALAVIERERLPLLIRGDQIVAQRVQAATNWLVWLTAGIGVGLAAEIVTMYAAWRRIMLPRENEMAATLATLSDSRRQFRSLFQENPDAIAYYDLEGKLLRGNTAAMEMFDNDPSLLGRPFTRHIAPEYVEEALSAFNAACAGTAGKFRKQFITATRERIDVEATLFPHIIDGRIVGVIGVAKDVRELKRAEAMSREQTERINDLYGVVASHGRTPQQQVEDTLGVAAHRLGYQWAAVCELADNTVTAVAIRGEASGFTLGETLPLARTLTRFIFKEGDVWSIDDLRATNYQRDLAMSPTGWTDNDGIPIGVANPALNWGAITGIPITIGDRTYGALELGGAVRRNAALTEADRDFMRLVAALIASIVERGEQERRLDSLAFFDGLTHLPNRALLTERLNHLVASAPLRDLHFALLYLDLDDFKNVNDVFGHGVGDEVLRIAALRMKSCIRESDTVARMGGDEFVVLLPGYGPHGAEEIAERILQAVKRPFVVGDVAHMLGVSVGIAQYPQHGDSSEALLKAADEALYRAKRAGRNCHAFAA